MTTAFFRRALVLAGALAVFGFTGCGKSSPPFNKSVEGVVKLDGVPLPSAYLEFVPIVNEGAPTPVSIGATDVNGHFKLAAEKSKRGAVIGKHKVLIKIPRPGRNDKDNRDSENYVRGPAVDLPVEYASLSQTPIEVEVTAEKHDYEIELKSKFN
jgi:hypothetical protein